MDDLAKVFAQTKPLGAVILLQFGFAGMSLITKFALNQGMSQHVLVVYRHAIATLVVVPFAIVFDRKIRPKMTWSIFIKILLLGLLEPVLDQNLFYGGMKYTSATFTSALCNVLPAFAFIFAWIFKLEKVNMRTSRSQAKILGTVVTVGGAMLLTLLNGPKLQLPWTNSNHHQVSSTAGTQQHPIRGALMITVGCFCLAGFIVLQAITLKSYPAELSLTAFICLVGTIGGSIVAVVADAGDASVWYIHFDSKLLAAVYGGVVCSGFAYYVQGMILRSRGPVFVTAFNPLSTVIVAILSSFILSETLYLGRVIGAIVIIIGLYMVLWGKSKDQPLSSLSIETEEANDLKMISYIDGNTKVSNQELAVLDLASNKVTPTDEYV